MANFQSTSSDWAGFNALLLLLSFKLLLISTKTFARSAGIGPAAHQYDFSMNINSSKVPIENDKEDNSSRKPQQNSWTTLGAELQRRRLAAAVAPTEEFQLSPYPTLQVHPRSLPQDILALGHIRRNNNSETTSAETHQKGQQKAKRPLPAAVSSSTNHHLPPDMPFKFSSESFLARNPRYNRVRGPRSKCLYGASLWLKTSGWRVSEELEPWLANSPEECLLSCHQELDGGRECGLYVSFDDGLCRTTSEPEEILISKLSTSSSTDSLRPPFLRKRDAVRTSRQPGHTQETPNLSLTQSQREAFPDLPIRFPSKDSPQLRHNLNLTTAMNDNDESRATIIRQQERQPRLMKSMCIDEMIIELELDCPSTLPMVPQQMLVGVASAIATAGLSFRIMPNTLFNKSLDNCVEECLRSRKYYGVDCHSAVYFPLGYATNFDCIMNEETAESRPELLMRNLPSDIPVNYFENPCTYISRPAETSFSDHQIKNQPDSQLNTDSVNITSRSHLQESNERPQKVPIPVPGKQDLLEIVDIEKIWNSLTGGSNNKSSMTLLPPPPAALSSTTTMSTDGEEVIWSTNMSSVNQGFVRSPPSKTDLLDIIDIDKVWNAAVNNHDNHDNQHRSSPRIQFNNSDLTIITTTSARGDTTEEIPSTPSSFISFAKTVTHPLTGPNQLIKEKGSSANTNLEGLTTSPFSDFFRPAEPETLLEKNHDSHMERPTRIMSPSDDSLPTDDGKQEHSEWPRPSMIDDQEDSIIPPTSEPVPPLFTTINHEAKH